MAAPFTFLFSDIEGSTRLWEQLPEVMPRLLEAHNRIIEQAVTAHNGRVFKTVGDGFCIVFDHAQDALAAALEAQRGLSALNTGQPVKIKARMGLHTGAAEARDSDYFGTTLNRVARLMATASGGQTVLSAATKAALGDLLPATSTLKDLGIHRLKDLREPEHIYQLVAPGLVNTFPPLKSLAPRSNNLPAQISSFVGREQEVEDACRLLRMPHVRLLTLLGPGGIGKTRLSLQIGHHLLHDFDDGVFFVALAPITQANGMIEAIAQAMKVDESGPVSLLERVKSFLQDRRLLLILDNFEQVVEAAPLINELLAAAAHLKVLTTSREELLVYGEHIYRVSALTLPESHQRIEASALTGYSAIALLVERIRAFQPDFNVDDETAPYLRQICQRLDGLPLAIELAAVRCRELSIAAIAEQLSSRLQVLSVGPRDLPSRQRTMRGAIEWSFGLLTAEEQQAFTRLGIFVGPFTAEAADTISGAQTLNRLKEKSLITAVHTTDNRLVFTMLETLHEYAIELLNASGELATLRRHHADYYLRLTETAEPNLTGERQVEWFNWLDDEHYNLQSALEWMLSEGDVGGAGRMTAVLWRFWSGHSQLSAGTHWIEQVLTSAATLPPTVEARLRYGLGRLLYLQYRYEASERHLQTSLQRYAEADDLRGQAAVYLTLGEIELSRMDVLAAERYFQSSLTIYVTLEDQAGFAHCLGQLGRLAAGEGNESGAEALFRQSLELTRQFGSTESIAMIINDLAEVLRTQAQYAEAETLYREALALYRQLDFDIGQAVVLHNLGQIDLRQGRVTEALYTFQKALRVLDGLEEKQIIVECLAGIGEALAIKGEKAQAVHFLSAAQAQMHLIPIELSPADQAEYDQTLQRAQKQVDEPTWTAAWLGGQATGLADIFAEALDLAC